MQDAIPYRLNAAIVSASLALHLALLFALPQLLAHSLAWAWVFVLLAWANVTHWALIHEAIHKMLFVDPRRNELGGRLLSVLFGASFHVLRFGHLMHHKLNRDWHNEDAYGADWRGRLGYYYTLTFGLYVSEVLTSLTMALLPRRAFMRLACATVVKDSPDVAMAGERFFYERGNIRFVRRDMACAALLYAAAFYQYAAYWPVLLGFLLLRGFVISFFDNLYHYGTPADNSKAAKELTLPEPVSRLLLHGNFHETHHLNPDVPWCDLPDRHLRESRGFDGGLVGEGLQQFAGPRRRGVQDVLSPLPA